MGRVWIAGGAVRDRNRNASERHDENERREVSRAVAEPRVFVRLGSRGGDVRRDVLQVDAVDLFKVVGERFGVPSRGAGELVSSARNGAGERGSDRWIERAREPSRHSQADEAVDVENHSIRRSIVGGLGRARLAGFDQGNATKLDR